MSEIRFIPIRYAKSEPILVRAGTSDGPGRLQGAYIFRKVVLLKSLTQTWRWNGWSRDSIVSVDCT